MRTTKYLSDDLIVKHRVYYKINESSTLSTIFLCLIQDFVVSKRVELFAVMKEIIPIDVCLIIFKLFYQEKIDECIVLSEYRPPEKNNSPLGIIFASMTDQYHKCEVFKCHEQIPKSIKSRYCKKHIFCQCGFSRMLEYACPLHDVQSNSKYNELCSINMLYVNFNKSKYMSYNIDYTEMYKK